MIPNIAPTVTTMTRFRALIAACVLISDIKVTGHFKAAFYLCVKTSLFVQNHAYENELIFMQMKLIFSF